MRRVIAVAIMSFIAGLAPSVFAAGEGAGLDKSSTQTATGETSSKGAGYHEETPALRDAKAKLKADKEAVKSDEAVLKDAQASGDAMRISDAQKKLADDQALITADRQAVKEARGSIGVGTTEPAGNMSMGNESEEKGGM